MSYLSRGDDVTADRVESVVLQALIAVVTLYTSGITVVTTG